ncbi:MAG: TRAP transporter substrate-binding protein DctP [Candidatus Firestonebacteria bacterium]
MIKKIITFLLFVILIFSSKDAYSLTIKLGTLAPEGSVWYDVLREMGEEWKKVSNGSVTLKIYAGGVAGDESDMIRKIRIGQLHSVAITGVGLSDITSEVQAMQMPMMIQSYEELDYIFEKVSKKLQDKLEAKGFKVLNWGDVGWVRFFSQKKVIYPDDLKDQSLFVWGGDTNVVSAWKDAGFRVVPLAPTDILTSLQTKMINAFSTTALAALSFQWFGLANNMTDLKWAPLTGATAVYLKTWETIPKDIRIKLEEVAKKKGEILKSKIRALDKEAIEIMKKYGLVVNEIPDEALTVWRSKSKAAYPRLLNTPELKEMYEEVNKYHEEFISGKKK